MLHDLKREGEEESLNYMYLTRTHPVMSSGNTDNKLSFQLLFLAVKQN